jgi:hypothetical protein
MNDKDNEAFEKWLNDQDYKYDTWDGQDYKDGKVVSIYSETEEAWQAACEYVRSEGPEDSVHKDGDIARNMTWKEVAEMMERAVKAANDSYIRLRDLYRQEKEQNKTLVEAMKWAKDESGCSEVHAIIDQALEKYNDK